MFVSVASTLHVVSEKYPGEVYGSKFFDKLGVDLRRELPDASGFSKVNLIYCLKFYELYSGCTIVPQLVEQSAKSRRGAAKMPQLVAEWGHRQLADGNLQQVVAQLVSVPWGHHRTIIDKCKDDRDVGGETKNIDLLFYIVPLHRYLVVEVKTGKYEPADLGQLSGYMAMAKHVLNTPGDNQPVGLLICKEHNRVLAKYHLEELGLPMGITDYELKKVLPTKAQLAKCVADAERQIAITKKGGKK